LPRLALAMRRKWCLAPGVSIPTERADRHCRNLNFYNSRMYRFKIIHNLKNVATEGERVSEEAKWSVNRRLNLRDCPFAYLLAMAKKDAQVESQKAEIAILRGRSKETSCLSRRCNFSARSSSSSMLCPLRRAMPVARATSIDIDRARPRAPTIRSRSLWPISSSAADGHSVGERNGARAPCGRAQTFFAPIRPSSPRRRRPMLSAWRQ